MALESTKTVKKYPKMPEAKKKQLNLSVHQLVDFLLREGDIDNRIYNQETMNLGSKIHSSFQKKQGKSYLSEVFLETSFERGDYLIHLEGRADGIIVGDTNPIIDEIKSTVSPLEEFYNVQKEWHYGQAKCYAYMYLKQENLPRANIRLTYISQQDFEQRMVKERCFTFEELQEYVYSLVDRYLEFNQREIKHIQERNISAASLVFPYPEFRKGQRDLAKYVYTIAQKGGIFFFEAPTGIGKTISTIYPAIKSFAKTDNQKIFYLTAKTSGRQTCYDALTACYEKGFVGRDSLLVAKEKICFSPGKNCNPDDCPFARDYYGKLRKIVEEESQENHRYNVDTVTEIARKNEICPFELQLDLSLLSDVIICDYNYFFDPLVKLERYFSDEVDSSKYFVLIDEAHNLSSRSKDMFSETITLKQIQDAKKELKGSPHNKVKLALGKMAKALLALPLEKDFLEMEKMDDELLKCLSKFRETTQSKNEEKESIAFPQKVKELSRKAYRFLFLMENCSQNLTLYVNKHGENVELHLQSLDPSPYLKEDLEKVKGAAIFSATLSPISYYMESLLGKMDYPYLALPSPFPKENFHLMIAPDLSIRYKNRGKTYDKVASYLATFVGGKKGNYFIYFPSYEYLKNIQDKLSFGDADVYIQEKDMSDRDKELFLSRFLSNPKKTTVGLLIIGGSFSEGIDLPSDRLIGVAVVGIGLPQISKETDLIREYYDKKNGKGFQFAYQNPGMNKVMQAVGRLIRSESDVGSALLIDDRYLQEDYRSLFERAWRGYEVVTSEKDIEESLSSFYRRKEK